ncbi:MAG: hypothetical protein ABSE36_20220 [Terracidiphilus sp.]
MDIRSVVGRRFQLRPEQKCVDATAESLAARGRLAWAINGLPGITLVVTDEGGGLTGAVLFYFQERKTVNDPWTATPGIPEPMLRVLFDGKDLTFQISHRRAHPPRSLSDPPVEFRLTLTGPNQAALVNENEKGPGFVLTRSDY